MDRAIFRSDLVRDSKLEARFPDNETTVHTYYVSSAIARRRKARVEERWVRQSQLGSGSFGVVWLEKCVLGSREGQTRAVKALTKGSPGSIDYGRELEAIAKFSHRKVSLLR